MSTKTEMYVRSKKFRPFIGWLEKSLSQFSKDLPPKGYTIWHLEMSEKDLKRANRKYMTNAYSVWKSLSEVQKSNLMSGKPLIDYLKNGFRPSIAYGDLPNDGSEIKIENFVLHFYVIRYINYIINNQ